MTTVELIEEVWGSVAQATGLNKSKTALVVRATFEAMTKALKNGEDVQLRGIGTLYSTTLKPRTYFGERVIKDGRTTVRFRTSRRSKWRSLESRTKKRP